MAAGGEDFRRAFGAELRMVLDRRRAEFAGEEPVDGGGAERQRPAQLLQPQRTVQTGAQVILRLLDFHRQSGPSGQLGEIEQKFLGEGRSLVRVAVGTERIRPVQPAVELLRGRRAQQVDVIEIQRAGHALQRRAADERAVPHLRVRRQTVQHPKQESFQLQQFQHR